MEARGFGRLCAHSCTLLRLWRPPRTRQCCRASGCQRHGPVCVCLWLQAGLMRRGRHGMRTRPQPCVLATGRRRMRVRAVPLACKARRLRSAVL
jgi:hypothetical protein